MNVERLMVYIGWLLADEKDYAIQTKLDAVVAALASLSESPSEPEYQTATVNGIQALETALNQLIASYDAVQYKNIESIGAAKFFSSSVVNDIKNSIRENSMTPAVAHEHVSNIQEAREAYLSSLDAVRKNLRALDFKADYLEAGSAEIGFEIPREIFNNNLEGLVNELRAVNRIIRAFSEVHNKTPEEVELHQISTTDPIFYFGLGALTISEIGKAIKWALDCWKKIEDIRKIRNETKNLKMSDKNEILALFDKKIQEEITAAIEKKTAEILGPQDGVAGRKQEQRTDMAWALESILSRVERGMTVEIRFLAPTKTEDGNQTEVAAPPIYQELQLISNTLTYPLVETAPVLAIPVVPTADPPKPRRIRQVRLKKAKPEPKSS